MDARDASASGQETLVAYPGQDLEALADLPNYYSWIADQFGPHLRGRVLEVGAGRGNFSAHMMPRVSEAVLSEPDVASHRILADRFKQHSRVTVLRRPPDVAADDASFDAVVAVNVLEHIADDVGAVQLWGRLLKPDGALLLFVPAVPWLYGSLDKAVLHQRRYTREGLLAVVRAGNLHPTSVRYFDSLGVLPWLLVGRVLRIGTFSQRGATMYDRVVVPPLRRVEARLAPPIGKNLVIVAVKR
jgi:SAM-dependent methyltransferase